MLRSSNPILSKKDAFTPAAPQYGSPDSPAVRSVAPRLPPVPETGYRQPPVDPARG